MTATIPEQRVLPPVGAGRRRGPRVELFATNLHTPTHMEWSQDGRLLVSETTAGRVTDITSGGDFIESAPFAWGLRGPASICPLPDGRILVAEIWGNRITDVSLGGDCMGRVPVADELNHPYSLGQMGSRVFVVERGGLSHTQVRDVTPDCNTTGEVYVSRIPAVPMLGLEGLRPMGTDQRDLAMGCDSWKLVAMIDGHERMIVSSSALGQLLVVPDGGGDYLDLVDRGCLLAYGLPWKGGFTQNPADGRIYVTLPTRGEVVAVDPHEPGDYRYARPVVTGLNLPTCVRFSEDGDTMFVCSMPGGAIWSVTGFAG